MKNLPENRRKPMKNTENLPTDIGRPIKTVRKPIRKCGETYKNMGTPAEIQENPINK